MSDLSSRESALAPRLTLSQKLRLTAEILVTYVRVRWAMTREELGVTVSRLRARRRGDEPLSRPRRVQLAAAVMRLMSVLPTDSRCLVRSLVLLALLERRAVDSILVIGVKVDPEFAAHAWVECDGEALLPAGDDFGRLTIV